MQTYGLKLESEIFKSFRCQKAADSLDIDVKKKSIHEFKVDADIETPFKIGLIVGASGSGKTTLAKHIYGDDRFQSKLDLSKPIIEQFPEKWSYDDCSKALCGIGLTSVPCWIRPAYTLSNGQRARAEAALQMALSDQPIIDEWTSVVDRTVAKVMSHCVSKYCKKYNKSMVLLSCHYDVIEWLDPDWIIDCNKQQFIDRRSLRADQRKRKEQLEFTIKTVDRSTWRFFSKYHYLSENLPAFNKYFFGLFHNAEQIGLLLFSNYYPWVNKTKKMQLHFNRLVIHPDYCGFGLGIKFLNAVCPMVAENYDVRGKFSSKPVFNALKNDDKWILKSIDRTVLRKGTGQTSNLKTHRVKIKTYSFKWLDKIEK